MKPTLTLFLTHGMELRDWVDSGTIIRELKLYNELSSYFEKIYIVSYGNNSELKYKSLISSNIEILTNRWLPNIVYSFLAPIIHYKKLKKSTILKTNQLYGSITAMISKLLFHNKLIIRQGYQWSYTLNQKKKSTFIRKYIAMLSESLAYRYADMIIVTSSEQLTYITKMHGVYDNICIIPNFVDTEIFKPLYNIKYTGGLLYIGRIAHEKNLINLIDAIKGTSFYLKIIGDGTMLEDIKIKLINENISNVTLRGRVIYTYLPNIINNYPIYIQPSLYEGNPKTILEAMSCGSIVIGTNVKGINNIIIDGYNGYLCEPTADSIQNTINRVHHAAPSELLFISSNARKTIENEYSLKVLLQEELKLYEKITH